MIASSPQAQIGAPPPRTLSIGQQPGDLEMPDAWKLAPQPSSPPTHIAELPDMESEPPQEVLRVKPEGYSLVEMGWEMARLNFKLKDLRRGAQTWAPKLNTLGVMALEHERVLREVPPVVHRLDQQHNALLHGVGQLQCGVGACSAEISKVQNAIGDLRQKIAEIGGGQVDLNPVYTQLQQLQKAIQSFDTQVEQLEKRCQEESTWRVKEENLLREQIAQLHAKQQGLEVQLRTLDPHQREIDRSRICELEAQCHGLNQQLAAGDLFHQKAFLLELAERVRQLETQHWEEAVSPQVSLPPPQSPERRGVEGSLANLPVQVPQMLPTNQVPNLPPSTRQMQSKPTREETLPSLQIPSPDGPGVHSTSTPPRVPDGAGEKVRTKPGSFHFAQMPPKKPTPTGWTLQRNWPMEPTIEAFSARSDPGETEGLSVAGVRAVSNVPTLLHPILGEAVKRHSPTTFSGDPSDFPSWKSAWEQFLATVTAISGGSSIAQGTLLLLLEGYLDGASKRMLRARRKEDPDLTHDEFFQSLCREMMPGPMIAEKNRWKTTKLSTKGGHLAMADWREFKAALEECLTGPLPPNDELRDHIVQQLPPVVKEYVLREEANASRNKHLVYVRPPLSIPREIVLDQVGAELGLRLQDLNPHQEIMMIDCLTETLQRKAISLDGLQIVDDLGRSGGTLSVWAVKNTPLTFVEILKLVDSQCWVERELQRLTPKEPEAPKELRETYAQAVQKSPSRQHPFKPPSPPSSPYKGGGKGFAKRPAQWCFTC